MKDKLKNLPKVGFLAPFDFNEVYGNTLRPMYELYGLRSNNFNNTVLYCLKSNKQLKFQQKEINRSILSIIPDRLKFKNASYLFDIPFLDKIRIKDNIDILQIENIYSFFAINKNKLKNVKIITDFHAIPSIALRDKYSNAQNIKSKIIKICIPLIENLERKAVTLSEKIIVASHNIKEDLICKYKIDEDKIEIINNMVNCSNFSLNKRYKIRGELTLGVIGPFTDDINNVISSIESISKKTKFKMKLIGRISKNDIQKLSKYSNIEVLGGVNSERYRSFFDEIDVLLLPYFHSHRGGGSRNKLLEAAASGVPIVSTSNGAIGFKEKYALLIGNTEQELIDNLRLLEGDISLRKHLGKSLRKIIQANYNYKKETKKLISIYNSLMGGITNE